jgi:hypothetical protein
MSAAESSEPIHNWFELTYANYLVLPRSFLQSMPVEWQQKFVALLEQSAEVARASGISCPEYRVQAVARNGKFMKDPVPHYNRGRTVLDLKLPPGWNHVGIGEID